MAEPLLVDASEALDTKAFCNAVFKPIPSEIIERQMEEYWRQER